MGIHPQRLFFLMVNMATKDITSPVAASQLAAGAFFSENGHGWIRQALLLLSGLPLAAGPIGGKCKTRLRGGGGADFM